MIKTLKRVGLVIGAIGFAFTLMASVSVTVTIPPAGITNVLTGLGVSGPVIVKQAVLTGTSNNTTVVVYDSPTNLFSFTYGPFTNTISYATNLPIIWTNFYGVSNGVIASNVLVDITNNVVPLTTNSYMAKISLSASAGNSTLQNNMSTYFENGLWATNTTTNTAIFTLTFIQ